MTRKNSTVYSPVNSDQYCAVLFCPSNEQYSYHMFSTVPVRRGEAVGEGARVHVLELPAAEFALLSPHLQLRVLQELRA